MMGYSATLASGVMSMGTLSSNCGVLPAPSWNLTSTQSMNGMAVWLTTLPASVPHPKIPSMLWTFQWGICSALQPSCRRQILDPVSHKACVAIPSPQQLTVNFLPMRPNSSEWCL